jgi:hypothetical protein
VIGTSETQVYEITVDKAKADAVFNAVKAKLEEAKAAGNIVCASWMRSSKDKGQI